MNNFETTYTVIGSSALNLQPSETIIEFPQSNKKVSIDERESYNPLNKMIHTLAMKFARSFFVQDISYGSIQGEPFNKAKSWQAILACCGFLAVALAFIYIGR